MRLTVQGEQEAGFPGGAAGIGKGGESEHSKVRGSPGETEAARPGAVGSGASMGAGGGEEGMGCKCPGGQGIWSSGEGRLSSEFISDGLMLYFKHESCPRG